MNGPTARVLLDARDTGGALGAAAMVVPPAGGLPEHAHGDSTVLLVVLVGELLVSAGEHRESVSSGVVVLVERGERVRLANDTDEPVSLLMVFVPGDFVGALQGWPVDDAEPDTTPGVTS